LFFWKKVKEKNFDRIDLSNLPLHIAIIMDGNGRWAKKRGLPRSFGHREGAKTLKDISKYCDGIGIKFLTVYTFSTENWKRPKDEVDYLMELLVDYLRNIETHLGGKSVKVRILGSKEGLPKIVQDEIINVESKTSKNSGMTLNLAINYGSRNEIVQAVKGIVKSAVDGEIGIDDINETLISKNLYSHYMPDPELLIRPGGEKRISNYLLWQCAYTEMYYSETLWPDFSSVEIDNAIIEYQKRNRRFGGI
jgi:undecaprenyl diphosphate synthase